MTQKWNVLLAENECLNKCEIIYPHHKNLSLVQEHTLLKESIAELFTKPGKFIGDAFRLNSQLVCATIETPFTKIVTSHVNLIQSPVDVTDVTTVEQHCVSLFIGLIDRTQMFFVEMNMDTGTCGAIRLEFQQKPFFDNKFGLLGDLQFRNCQFYNEAVVSMLLQNDQDGRTSNCFLQLPVAQLRPRLTRVQSGDYVNMLQSVGITNLYEIVDATLIRPIEVNDGDEISVSGSRKVDLNHFFDKPLVLI